MEYFPKSIHNPQSTYTYFVKTNVANGGVARAFIDNVKCDAKFTRMFGCHDDSIPRRFDRKSESQINREIEMSKRQKKCGRKIACESMGFSGTNKKKQHGYG